MLIVHLFVSYAHVNLCHFFLPPGVRGWPRLLLVTLPELFCLPFCIPTEKTINTSAERKCIQYQLEFVFYVKTDVSPLFE